MWLVDEIDERGEAQPEPITQPVGAETGPDQIQGGSDSYQERSRLTPEHVQELQDALKTDPYQFLKTKASYGQPAGTVIIPVWSTDELLDVQSRVMGLWERARLTPSHQFHITLVHAPLVEEVDFKAVNYATAKRLKKLLPVKIETGEVEIFGEEAVVLRVKGERLKDIQRIVAEEFATRYIPTSLYSEPDNWQAHITLGYVSAPMEINLITESVELVVNAVAFTRTSYETEAEVWLDGSLAKGY
jgi:2'-5' RNA ligase